MITSGGGAMRLASSSAPRRDLSRNEPQLQATPLSFHKQYKILMLGDSGVGKSSIILRFANDTFTPNFLPTIGIDYKSKTIEMPATKSRPPRTIRMVLWDTAGQERFRTITKAYMRGSNAVVLVYDSTDRHTFENVDNWLACLEEMGVTTHVVIVANKSDCTRQTVLEEEGRSLAAGRGVSFFVTSAKLNEGISAVFDHLAKQLEEETFRLRIASSASGSSATDPFTSIGFRVDHKALSTVDGKVPADNNTCCGGGPPLSSGNTKNL